MKYVVTGGAGFIGSHVVDRLLGGWHDVVCVDNLSTGRRDNIEHNLGRKNFGLIKDDLKDVDGLADIFRGADTVFHFAANADIRGGVEHPRRDMEQNTAVTHNVLDAMRLSGVRKIVFASSSAVYGEPDVFPTPENCPLIPTSLYGASKVACEALISAYCNSFDFQAWIFRLAGVIGERHSHGVIRDFVNKLNNYSRELRILGSGEQVKSFIYIGDCIDGMMFAYDNADGRVNTYNIGTSEAIKIRRLALVVADELDLNNVRFRYVGDGRGWVGDSPIVLLSTEKIRGMGWSPRIGIEEAIRKTVRWLMW